MKKATMTAATAAFLLAGVGAAMATDQNINITATVNGFCTIAGSEIPGNDSAAINTSGGNVVVAAIYKTYPVVCNKAADTKLTSQNGGLSGPAAVTGFDHIINYMASTSGFVVNPGGSTATNLGVGAAEQLGATVATGGASAASVTVTITPIANGQPLLAGSYADILTLTISPQ